MSYLQEDKSSFLATRGSLALILIIATSTVILIAPNQFVQAIGEGDKTIWKEGTLLSDEFQAEEERTEVNTLFARPKESEEFSELSQEQADKLYERYVDLVRRWQIDVVEARRDLTQLMKVVSTKSQAEFLTRHDNYYKLQKVGTTNRPMLLAYLGLRISSRDKLREWLDRAVRGPAGDRIVNSCMSLLVTRDERAPTDTIEADQKLLKDIGELQPKRNQAYRFYLAHLTFENNMRLFMLENFLILCSKLHELVPQRVNMPEFGSQYKPLF